MKGLVSVFIHIKRPINIESHMYRVFFSSFLCIEIFSGELWQYVKVPITWSDSGSDSQTLGVTGYVMSGATIYDHRSSPFGDLASYYEWDSLDPSFGHSDQNKQYHYHAVSTYQYVN